MEFMEAYKSLDRACKVYFGSEKGVTTYIEEMELRGKDITEIDGWKSDYQNLKRYRFIRNKISHDVGYAEDGKVTEEDIAWLCDFEERIQDGNDPITLHDEKFGAPEIPEQTSIDDDKMSFSDIIYFSVGLVTVAAVIAAVVLILINI